ncbi:hypothetical protein B0H12DRAFT_1229783 [Mycena haematopus]|nr:hypothetical protein B0H12DRAFT_1229783 [Mycena haematopus]
MAPGQHPQGIYGFNPWMAPFPPPYPQAGYQPFPNIYQNPWHFGFNPHPGGMPLPPPPQFAPPPYPPPPIPASIIAPIVLPAAPHPDVPTPIPRIPKDETLVHNHGDAAVLDWPTGFTRRECNTGEESHKWKHNKWVWRSKGIVQHQGNIAETQPAARRLQIKNGCTGRTCRIDSPLIHDTCDARTFHFKLDRHGQSISVWEHYGDHSTHARPPGGTLSKAQEDQVDLQVMRRHDANAHELRTGDPGPGSIPLPAISATLAAPSSARYHLSQSQARLGLNTGSSKGGLAFLRAFGDLNKRLSTPFIIDSSLSGPIYMTFQTPFMDFILCEAVETWILDLKDGPESSRHGMVIDSDHTFFREGQLLASCAFSAVTREWTPILYSWINGADRAHHRPHFGHLFRSIIKHAGDRFTRKLLLCVMDFSGAQRGAHADEYADAIISTMPHFAQLSKEAQDAEHRHLIIEAEKDQVKKTHALIPPESATIFEKNLRELIAPTTTSGRFDEIVLALKTAFPSIKAWLSWWERRPIASMIFPAKSSVDAELAAKAPSTTNPVEHGHSLLHHAVGKDQELFPGIEKLFLHVHEMENKYKAIEAGHFNAGDLRNRRPPKPRVYEENDGRAPDTLAALAVAAAAEAASLPTPPAPPAPSDPVPGYSPRMLQSFRWDEPNSCFFDTPLEIWFRAFSRWSEPERRDFLSKLPSSSALANFFYNFQRRLRWISEGVEVDIHGIRDLSLCQSHARMLIFDRWKLYDHPQAYGNAASWLRHAIQDSGTSIDIQLYFRVAHILSGVCPFGHTSLVGLHAGVSPFGHTSLHTSLVELHGTPDVLAINLFDLRTTRVKCGPMASLTEYFANFTPRLLGGNESGGTRLVHTMETLTCQESGCSASFEPDSIETRWPKILQINPDTGTQPPLPITQAFTVNDVSGASVSYDDLIRRGALVPLGTADLICIPDRRAVMWTYHRMSTTKTTTRTVRSVSLAYAEALTIESAFPPPSPGPTIGNTPEPDSSKSTDHPIDLSLAPFPILGTPPPSIEGAPFPERPPPTHWCSICRKISAGDDGVIPCVECHSRYHVSCLRDADCDFDLQKSDEWFCTICVAVAVDTPVTWSEDLLGDYVMFQTRPGSSFYPARIAALTSTGMVRMEWYQDNIYERGEIPLESEFVCSQQECANAAAVNPDVLYHKDNVGAIKWPPRLMEDGSNFGYENPEISAALYDSRSSIVAIIMGTNSTAHPIGSDYDKWMSKAPELSQARHADAFASQFSFGILPGDASLIEPHHTHVFETAMKLASSGDSSESQRLRTNVLASVLFSLVVLRIYLRRPPRDDIQVYFLALPFSKKQRFDILDESFAAAKMGKVPESTSGFQNMPPNWCKIKTVFRKAAAARIPAGVWLADAVDVNGYDYNWDLANDTHGWLASSPLTDLPNSDGMDIDPVAESGAGKDNKITDMDIDVAPTLKRKHVDNPVPEENRDIPLRRSNRTRTGGVE